MLICDNGVIREMTETEEYTAEHLPNPEDIAGADELLAILTGDAE